jgi:hypothetical protein
MHNQFIVGAKTPQATIRQTYDRDVWPSDELRPKPKVAKAYLALE